MAHVYKTYNKKQISKSVKRTPFSLILVPLKLSSSLPCTAGVRSECTRIQLPPEWAFLSQVDCSMGVEVIWNCLRPGNPSILTYL